MKRERLSQKSHQQEHSYYRCEVSAESSLAVTLSLLSTDL